jgi:hypothetical protein
MAFDPTKEEHLTERIINGYITHMMIYYTATNCKDKDLWYTFCEDFEGVTIDILNIAQWTALRELQEYLIIHRVWVKPVRGSTLYAKALYDYLSKDTPSEWTEECIEERKQLKGRQKTAQPQSPKGEKTKPTI